MVYLRVDSHYQSSNHLIATKLSKTHNLSIISNKTPYYYIAILAVCNGSIPRSEHSWTSDACFCASRS